MPNNLAHNQLKLLIKSESLPVNYGKMWIKFAKWVKNFHIVDLIGILGIGLVEWREIGWG
jgi:hypothetical protein